MKNTYLYYIIPFSSGVNSTYIIIVILTFFLLFSFLNKPLEKVEHYGYRIEHKCLKTNKQTKNFDHVKVRGKMPELGDGNVKGLEEQTGEFTDPVPRVAWQRVLSTTKAVKTRTFLKGN